MASCSGFIMPFDLECIFVNLFAGSMDIFIFISLIAIVCISAYFRMIEIGVVLMFVVFGIIISAYFNGILFLSLLIGGLAIIFIISKLVKN